MKSILTPDKQQILAMVLMDTQGRVLTPGSVFDSTGTYSFDLPSLAKAYTYDGANNVATITYGPDANGRKVTVTRTWAGGLLQAESAPVLSSTAASTLTLSGANTAVVGNASADITVTVGPAGSAFSPFTFTPGDGGAGGTFTPESVVLSYGQRAATFKYTPRAEGVKSLTGAVDQGGLAVAAPLDLTASQPGKAQAPAQVTATVDGTSVTLTWSAVPDSGNGGSPVQQYAVALSSGQERLVESTVHSWTFVNLAPGVAVTGSVAAVTSMGAGAAGTTDAVVPSKPSVTSMAINGAAVGAAAI